jgi:hypothetical protein
MPTVLSTVIRRLAAGLALALAGCVTPPQAPIAWNAQAAKASPSGAARVGVVMSELPKPNTYFPGASCLLCIAVAEAAHSVLSTHVKSLNTDDLATLTEDVVGLLKAQGFDAFAITAPLKMDTVPARTVAPNESRYDFAALRTRHNVDRLIVLELPQVAVERAYAAYVPQGAPYALVAGQAYLVDVASHKLLWNQPVRVVQTAQGAWDEPPKFPGLTNAYYQAIERAKDEIKRSLENK